MTKEMLCGEALMQLLEAYGVDTVFGIPGVHTLDLYRGISATKIRHVQCRNEQGGGYMADGYARLTGRPGVCVVISGPGVTNAATALGQAYADSAPLLCISAVTASRSLGKGWGCLHEITDQEAVTAPLTAMSVTAREPEELPELVAQAFASFAAGRPRPVHIAVPVDVLGEPVEGGWRPCGLPSRPQPDPARIAEAAELLAGAKTPVLLLGGGAVGAGAAALSLAERVGAAVFATNAGKGIVPESHPLSLGARLSRPEARPTLAEADVVVAAGTELAETDAYIERLEIGGRLVRIDIDPRKLNDRYPSAVGIVADAEPALRALDEALAARGVEDDPGGDPGGDRAAAERAVAEVCARVEAGLGPLERKHLAVWNVLRGALPEEAAIWADTTQIVYTGGAVFPVEAPRRWIYPVGYCTLGCGLPMAIGGKVAEPERPMVAVAGDGGLMFTIQELATAVEEKLSLPILLWNNDGLQQIRDDMLGRNIPTIGVNSLNPDFLALGRAFGCEALRAESAEQLAEAVTAGQSAGKPTLIEVREDAAWLG